MLILKADKSGRFVECAKVSGNEYMDFSIGKSENPRSYTYRICPAGFHVDSASAFEVKADVPAATDSALLDMVQKYTLKYFADFAHPQTGLSVAHKFLCINDMLKGPAPKTGNRLSVMC